MKKSSVSSAASRRTAQSASSASSAAPNATAATAEPPPPPTPVAPKTIQCRLVEMITGVFAGNFTGESDRWQPPVHVKRDTGVYVGVLTSQQGREFFSLGLKLQNEAETLTMPRIASEVDGYLTKKAELMRASNALRDLGWIFVHNEFPQIVGRGSHYVADGWVIYRTHDREDQLRNEAQRRDVQPDQIDAWVKRYLDREKREKLEVDLDERGRKEQEDESDGDMPEGLGFLQALAGLGRRGRPGF